MVSLKNKYVLLAGGFWLAGILALLLGAWARREGWAAAGWLLTVGVTGQAVGFGFLGFALMQAVFSKKK